MLLNPPSTALRWGESRANPNRPDFRAWSPEQTLLDRLPRGRV